MVLSKGHFLETLGNINHEPLPYRVRVLLSFLFMSSYDTINESEDDGM